MILWFLQGPTWRSLVHSWSSKNMANMDNFCFRLAEIFSSESTSPNDFFSFYKYCMRAWGIQKFIISSWSDKNDSYGQFFPLIGAIFKKSPEYRSPYDLLVVQIMCMKSFTEIPDFILIWQKNMAVMSNSCFWLVEIKKNLWNFKFKWSASLVTHEIKIKVPMALKDSMFS